MKRIIVSAFSLAVAVSLLLNGVPFGLHTVEATHGELKVHMVNVSGAGFIVELPNHKVMVVDSGVGDSTNATIFFDKLDALGITHIDYLVGTHHHVDHIGNHNNILNNYSVGEVIFPRYSATSSQDYTYMENAADNHNVNIRKVEDGQRIFSTVTVDGKELKTLVFAPISANRYDNDVPAGHDSPGTWIANANSLVFHIKYGSKGIMFTGDAKNETTDDVATYNSLSNIQVYVAAHHGEDDESNSSAFLQTLDPNFVMIPEKEGTRPHFKNTLRTLGYKFWSTNYNGTVYLKTDGSIWYAEETDEP